jgi:hypothetical protein
MPDRESYGRVGWGRGQMTAFLGSGIGKDGNVRQGQQKERCVMLRSNEHRNEIGRGRDNPRCVMHQRRLIEWGSRKAGDGWFSTSLFERSL